jgi:hypothetical protein
MEQQNCRTMTFAHNAELGEWLGLDPGTCRLTLSCAPFCCRSSLRTVCILVSGFLLSGASTYFGPNNFGLLWR